MGPNGKRAVIVFFRSLIDINDFFESNHGKDY